MDVGSSRGMNARSTWIRRMRSLFLMAIVTMLVAWIAMPGLAAEQRKPVTIRFWNWWDLNREPLMKKVLEEFQKKYPWITVKNMIQPWGGRDAKVLSALISGDPPELIMATRQEVINLADRGALAPITEYIKKYKLNLNLFYPAEVGAFKWKGEQWTLPMPTVTGNDDLYAYNKTMFDEAGLDPEKPPTTWKSFDDVAKKLTIIGGDGKMKQIGAWVSSQQFMAFLYSNNGKFLSEDGRTATFNSREGIETLEYLVNRVNGINGGWVTQEQFKGPGGALTSKEALFYRGLEGMLFENVSLFQQIRRLTDKDFEWGVGLIPYNSGNPKAKSTGVAGVSFGWGYVIPAAISDEKKEAAYLLLQFLTTEDKGTGYFMFHQARPSPVRKFNQNPKYYEINPNWKDVLKALETDVPFPITPVQSQMLQYTWTELDKALRGISSPKVALDGLSDKVQKLLDGYWKKK